MYSYSSRKPLKRPPSYSDSFVLLSTSGKEKAASSADGTGSFVFLDLEPLSINGPPTELTLRPTLPLLTDRLTERTERTERTTSSSPPPSPVAPPTRSLHPVASAGQFSTFSIPAGFSTTEKWATRFLGFGVHLSLVSVFETLFFFLFISKSEDSGLTGVLDGYVGGILASCHSWPANTTVVVNDILSVLINATQVASAANQAALQRQAYNRTLELQAWGYVGGLIGIVLLSTWVTHHRGLRIAWRRILLENLIMVSLLGLYELMFFKTIIYRYENMSLPELDGFVVGQLQAQCGLLSSL